MINNLYFILDEIHLQAILISEEFESIETDLNNLVE